MSLFLIFINFVICIYAYFKEKTFGIASVFVFGMILIYFVPFLYNISLSPNFDPHPLVQAAWLAGSVLILRQKYTLNSIHAFFASKYQRAKLVQIFLLSLIILSILATLGLIGFGHICRFPTIGFFVNSCLWGMYSFKNRKHFRSLWVGFMLLTVSSLLIFYNLLWSGFGRLILFQFITIGFFFTSFSLPKVWFFKLMLIVSLPFLILIGGVLRSGGGTIESILLESRGLGSLLSPVQYTESLYKDMRDERYPKLWGESYVATGLFYVPRFFWTGKPLGFGRQMTLWYLPRNNHPGHSLAGTHLGEAFANFGRIGLLIGPLMLLLFITIIKKLLCKRRLFYKTRHLVGIIIGVLLLATMSDFLWGGTFTSITRAGIGAILSLPFIFPIIKLRLF